MSLKLRDLIRNVRLCKTAAEERAVIAKESAEIRTAFKGKGVYSSCIFVKNELNYAVHVLSDRMLVLSLTPYGDLC